MAVNTLTHAERLRSIGAIKRLFESGQSGFIYPFRYVWFAEADQVPSTAVLFSVPKKFHRRANKRNLLKRRVKEVYRLNKSILIEENKRVVLDVALVYSAKEVLSYKKINHAVKSVLAEIAKTI